MLGWRARLGVIFTHSVIGLVPHEFYRIAPDGLVLLAIGLGQPTPKAFWSRPYEAVRDDYRSALAHLVEEGAEVVHLGGGDDLLTYGTDGLTRLLDDLRAVSPVRVKSTPTVLGPALRAVGVDRVAIAGNYSANGIANTTTFLRQAGVEVVGSTTVALNREVGISPYPAYRAAKRALAENPGANGVLLTGAAWAPIAILDEIEADLGVPVITSVQAMVWSSLRWVGVHQPLPGSGSLLRAAGNPPGDA